MNFKLAAFLLLALLSCNSQVATADAPDSDSSADSSSNADPTATATVPTATNSSSSGQAFVNTSSDSVMVAAVGASVNNFQQLLQNFQLLMMNRASTFNILGLSMASAAANLTNGGSFDASQINPANLFNFDVAGFASDVAAAADSLDSMTMAGSQAPINSTYEASEAQSVSDVASALQAKASAANSAFNQLYQNYQNNVETSAAAFQNLSVASVNQLSQVVNSVLSQLDPVMKSLSMSRSKLAAAAVRA